MAGTPGSLPHSDACLSDCSSTRPGTELGERGTAEPVSPRDSSGLLEVEGTPMKAADEGTDHGEVEGLGAVHLDAKSPALIVSRLAVRCLAPVASLGKRSLNEVGELLLVAGAILHALVTSNDHPPCERLR